MFFCLKGFFFHIIHCIPFLIPIKNQICISFQDSTGDEWRALVQSDRRQQRNGFCDTTFAMGVGKNIVLHIILFPHAFGLSSNCFRADQRNFLWVTNAGLKRAVRAEGALLPSNHCWRAAIFFLLYLASIFNLALLFCSLSMRSSFIKILSGNKCREKKNISRGEGRVHR